MKLKRNLQYLWQKLMNNHQILAPKQSDPNANTSDLEQQIDRLVYELYGLSEEEIKIIES